MTLSPDDVAARIREHGIIAIVRGDYLPAALHAAAKAAADGGIRLLEITLNSPGALAAIGMLRAAFGDRLTVGAGTVRVPEQAEAAAQAGAQFLVAPGFDAPTVAAARRLGLLHLPGVLTPTEAMAAAAAGCRMLKLFPADSLGPGYLRALRAPLNDLEFVPTGGIGADNLGAFVAAGAVAVGVGSTLLSGPHQPPAEVAARARALCAAWERTRAEAG